MRVTVRLFARLRDIAGAGELTRDAPPGGATVGAVWASLVADYPELSAVREIDLVRGQRRLFAFHRGRGGW